MTCEHCDVTIVDLQGAEGSIPCSNGPLTACKSCTVELANHDNAINRLKTKRIKLKRIINRSHSPFIRIIPPEIIARISEFAITDFRIIGSLPDVILLSSVCSDWRRIVAETPQLWSSIKIDLPLASISQTSDIASSKLLRLATFIDEWLTRSGQLPLNISVCYGHHDETLSDSLILKEYRPIFEILNQYSSRWQRLDMSIPTILLSFLQPQCLPLLEQLHITYGDHDHVITFPPTPCLNKVKIEPFMNSAVPISLNIGIQWNTVTHLSAESITTGSCFALLRLSPQLVHCAFHKIVDDDIHHLVPPILSQLTYLSLHLQSYRPCRILNNIKLPSLETLVLFNVSIDPVIAFLARSACSLHTLSLLNWQIRKTEKIIPLLQFLSPSLRRLAISRPPSPMHGTRDYLWLLTQIYTSQSEGVGNDFLPHLEIFEYREESPSRLESSILLNLPSRNLNHPKATTSISLRLAHINVAGIMNKIPSDISPILERLQEDGILTYN